MDRPVTPIEAQAALDAIERRRLRVIDEIDVPWLYWWGLALGWIALGVIADVGPDWLTTVATIAFGAAHASVAPRVISGRHASRDLSVRAGVAPPHLARIVIGGLVVVVFAVGLVRNILRRRRGPKDDGALVEPRDDD